MNFPKLSDENMYQYRTSREYIVKTYCKKTKNRKEILTKTMELRLI